MEQESERPEIHPAESVASTNKPLTEAEGLMTEDVVSAESAESVASTNEPLTEAEALTPEEAVAEEAGKSAESVGQLLSPETPVIEEAVSSSADVVTEAAPTEEIPMSEDALEEGSSEALPCESSVTKGGSVWFGKLLSVLTKKQMLSAVLAPVILAAGIGLGIWIGSDRGDIDRDAVNYEWTPPEGSVGNADGIVLPGYGSILLPADEETVALILPNPKGNPCHFRFTLRLTEQNEVLYRSGLIPPGMAVTEIALSRPLAAGDYPLEILIETYSLEGGEPLNGGSIRLVMEVR